MENMLTIFRNYKTINYLIASAGARFSDCLGTVERVAFWAIFGDFTASWVAGGRERRGAKSKPFT